MDGQLTVVDVAGSQEFKQQIYSQLKKSGVVSSLRSQLRTQLLQQLRKLAGPDALKAAAGGDQQARSMWHSAVNCIVAEYLQTRGYQFALSVFRSDADMAEQPAFSDEELCQVMRLDRHPRLLERLHQLMQSEGCLVLALVQALATTASAATVDSSCQTSSSGHVEGLNRRLLQLEDSYMTKAAQTTVSRVTLDDQMAAYKQECDALAEMQVASRVARIKDVELAAVRQEAAAKCHQQLELDRAELDRIHADRLARLAARETDVTEKLRRQQRDVDSDAYAQRQRLLVEEERVRGMKAEVGRQLEIQEQLLKGLEAQLKEREKAVAARETAAECKLAEAAELETKMATAVRKQAAAELAEEQAALRGERTAVEAERARVSELRSAVNTDLAIARAKEDRLRTVESARAEAEARSAAHAAGEEVLRLQLKHLQAELAAMQQELVRAGASAGANAAAAGEQQLYPGGEAGAATSAAAVSLGVGGLVQLPQALRELGQLQRRAQEAESALDETIVERDSAVSKAEELSINLNAARREIAALRNQVSRQQQDIIQLKVQLSHANAAAIAAGAGGRSTALGLRGSISSMRGVSPSVGGLPPAGGLGHYTSSPLKGLPGLGLAPSTDFGVAGRSGSPVYGVGSRAMTTGGLSDAWRAGLTAVGGHAVSAGGAEEVQAAASRIAQLAAADASMSQRLADFRRRSAAQRAAAAQQLADLKAISGSGSSSSSAGAAAAAASSGVIGGPQQQQRHRLSIPSEYEHVGSDVIDDVSMDELLQLQQRREAIEIALQPHAVTAAQLASAAAIACRPYSSNGRPGSSPAAIGGVGSVLGQPIAAAPPLGVYRLDDVLRAAGSLRNGAGSPQQQLHQKQQDQQQQGNLQQFHHEQQQQQQQQEFHDSHIQQREQHEQQHWVPDSTGAGSGPLFDAVGAAAGAPVELPHSSPSSNTELSFVEHLHHHGAVVEDSANSHNIGSSEVDLQERLHQHENAQQHIQEGSHHSYQGDLDDERSQRAELVARRGIVRDRQQQQAEEEEQQVNELSCSQDRAASGSNSSSAGVWVGHTPTPAAAATDDDVQSVITTAAGGTEALAAAIIASPLRGQALQLQEELQQDLEETPDSPAAAHTIDVEGRSAAPDGGDGGVADDENATAAAAGDVDYADAEADAIDEGIELADDFIAELSALSSAVALEAAAAAAAMEGVRMSGSSTGMTASGIGVDRYGSIGGAYDSDEDDSQDGDHQNELPPEQEGDESEYDYAIEAPGHHQQQQQGQEDVVPAPQGLQGHAASWEGSSPAGVVHRHPQQQSFRAVQPSASGPGGYDGSVGITVGGAWRKTGGSDDDGSADDVALGELAVAADNAAAMIGQLRSPPSSEDSVF